MKAKTVPIIIAILIPIISVATALSLIYFKKKGTNDASVFPYEAYIKEPENLYGNSYLLKAEFELQLATIAGKGRVISVRDSSTGKKLAVLVPDNLSGNIMTHQRYEMDVRVGKGGAVIVESMQKY